MQASTRTRTRTDASEGIQVATSGLNCFLHRRNPFRVCSVQHLVVTVGLAYFWMERSQLHLLEKWNHTCMRACQWREQTHALGACCAYQECIVVEVQPMDVLKLTMPQSAAHLLQSDHTQIVAASMV